LGQALLAGFALREFFLRCFWKCPNVGFFGLAGSVILALG